MMYLIVNMYGHATHISFCPNDARTLAQVRDRYNSVFKIEGKKIQKMRVEFDTKTDCWKEKWVDVELMPNPEGVQNER